MYFGIFQENICRMPRKYMHTIDCYLYDALVLTFRKREIKNVVRTLNDNIGTYLTCPNGNVAASRVYLCDFYKNSCHSS